MQPLAILVLALWLITAAVWFLRSLPAVIRDAAARLRLHGRALPALLAILLIACCIYGSTKPPPEPPPPAAPVRTGRISLYHEDATGRLVPLDARIREVAP